MSLNLMLGLLRLESFAHMYRNVSRLVNPSDPSHVNFHLRHLYLVDLKVPGTL